MYSYEKKILFLLCTLATASLYAQNISVNTTGAANSTNSMFEVLQPSATNNTSGLFVRHSGSPTNAYGLWVEMTGAPTNKYAIVVNGGGNVGIGTTTPSAKLSFNDLSDGTNGADGITWYNPAPTAYGIFRSPGAWNGPSYQQLTLAWQTGITIDGGSAYGLSGTIIQPTAGNVAVGQAVKGAYNLEVNGTFGFGDGTAGSYRSRTETRNDAGQMATQSGFYQTSAPAPAADWPVGASSWWHLIDVRHSNPGNNYAMQFAGSFFDQDLYFRKTNNNAAQAWSQILTTASTGYIKNQFAGAQTADHWVSGSSRATEVYCADWFRNDNINTGLYNQATGAGIWSTAAGLMSTYNGACFQIDGASNGSGNLRFVAANPYIVSSSYFVCPGGAYFNSGTVYTEAQYQCRGGIHNDNGNVLTIAGGSDGNSSSYFPNRVGINVNTSSSFYLYTSTSSTASGDAAIKGIATNGGNGAIGLFGETTATNTNNSSGDAILGVNNVTGITTYAATGVEGWVQYPNSLSYNAFYGNGRLVCTGTKSCVTPTSKGQTLLYCTESPEVWFEDIGSGQLQNGYARIELDKLFLETVTINEKHPIQVFIQLEDECPSGVYVKKNDSYFEVHQQGGGNSNAKFAYHIFAKRKGNEDTRLEIMKPVKSAKPHPTQDD